MTTLAELQAELQQRARQRFSRTLARPLVYVALGASDAAGMGASSPANGYVPLLGERLKAHYRPDRRVAVHNLGVSGYTIVDIARDELPRVAPLAPDVVTLWTGGNDVLQSVPADEFRANLALILGTLQRTGAAVFVGSVPDLSVVPLVRSFPAWFMPLGNPVDFARRHSEELADVALRLVPAYDAQLVRLPMGEILTNPALVALDGFHPSDLGHARLAAAWWEEMRGLLD